MDSFFIYDMIFLIVFTFFVVLFLYKRRNKLEREGVLYLYRTQVGIKVINYIGKKYEKLLRFLEYLVIITGYALMAFMVYILGKSVLIFLNPVYVKAIKIPPIAPLIPYLPQIFKVDFLPPFYFTYWILALAIVAIVHEFSHGIFARLHNVKIKSTGFGFLGPFLAAFVEPDENKVKKLRVKNQLSIMGAGVFANVVVTIIFFLLMWVFFALTFTASGAMFDTYTYNFINSSSIQGTGNNLSINFDGGLNLTEVYAGNKTYLIDTSSVNSAGSGNLVFVYEDTPALRAGLNGIITGIDGKKVKTRTDLSSILGGYSPGDKIIITALQSDKTTKNFSVELGVNPVSGKAYLGVAVYQEKATLFGNIRKFLTFFKEANVYYAPKFSPDLIVFIYNLFYWIVLINISVALVNMLPVGIFDGGRFFYITIEYLFNKKTAKILYKIATYAILGVLVLLMALWVIGFFG